MRIRFLVRSSMVVKGTKATCKFYSLIVLLLASSDCISQWFDMAMYLTSLPPYVDCRRIAPTILLDVPQDSLIMQEEIFGPLLPIVTVGTKTSVSKFFLNEKNAEKKNRYCS